jgi:hypothetical protein
LSIPTAFAMTLQALVLVFISRSIIYHLVE